MRAIIVLVLVLIANVLAFRPLSSKIRATSSVLAALEYDDQGYIIKKRESGWFNGLSTNPGDSLNDPRAVPPAAVAFADKVKSGEKVSFDESIALIDEHYYYVEVPFSNGDLTNAANENIGSAKILAFGLITQMTKEQTLGMFGDFYRNLSADGSDHMNIRNFIKNGFDGVVFDRGIPITSKLQSGDSTDDVMATQAVNEGEGEWTFDSDSWMP
jgi:hypothetical protein